MSKVVRAVAGGLGTIVKGVTKAIKKVAKSKLGKVLITAAAIYFGGAALQGMMQGASAGSGFMGTISSGLQGAAQGIGNAWSSLGTAVTQAAGGNFASAGNALSTGFQGGTASMVDAGGSALANTAANTAADAAFTGATETGLATLPGDAANVLGGAGGSGGSGMIGKMMASQYTAPALISGGTQLIGGVMQGYGANKQQDQQIQLAQDERNRYNTNVGTRLWG